MATSPETDKVCFRVLHLIKPTEALRAIIHQAIREIDQSDLPDEIKLHYQINKELADELLNKI